MNPSNTANTNTKLNMKMALIAMLFLALAINSSSLFSQWASSACRIHTNKKERDSMEVRR